jgi:Na+-transporting methylmalonyl-CoA/oxaloacetate decarboxylase gamma subunit
MGRQWAVLILLVPVLAGCGVAETGAAGASAAESAAQQAAQAQSTQAEVRKQIDAAYQEDAERRRAADRVGQ